MRALESHHDPNTKPPISFACLIAMAILDSQAKKLTVHHIYEWVMSKYPFYRSGAAGTGWKNSIRHNLSLNKHFMRVCPVWSLGRNQMVSVPCSPRLPPPPPTPPSFCFRCSRFSLPAAPRRRVQQELLLVHPPREPGCDGGGHP